MSGVPPFNSLNIERRLKSVDKAILDHEPIAKLARIANPHGNVPEATPSTAIRKAGIREAMLYEAPRKPARLPDVEKLAPRKYRIYTTIRDVSG